MHHEWRAKTTHSPRPEQADPEKLAESDRPESLSKTSQMGSRDHIKTSVPCRSPPPASQWPIIDHRWFKTYGQNRQLRTSLSRVGGIDPEDSKCTPLRSCCKQTPRQARFHEWRRGQQFLRMPLRRDELEAK